MKSLTEYSKEYIYEGSISEWLKGIWKWLFGNKKDKYDVYSDYYDEEEKIKYIEKNKQKVNSNSKDSSKLDNNIVIEEITNPKLLDKVIDSTLGKLQKTGLWQVKQYLEKNPERKKLNDKNIFLSFIFKTKDLTECVGLIGISLDEEKYKNDVFIYISNFLSLYINRKVINVSEIINFLKKYSKRIIIDDEKFINLCIDNDIDLERENDVYIIK